MTDDEIKLLRRLRDEYVRARAWASLDPAAFAATGDAFRAATYAAHAALPRLLDELERLERERDEARRLAEELAVDHDARVELPWGGTDAE